MRGMRVLFTVTHNDTEVDTIQSPTASLEAEPTDLRKERKKEKISNDA